MRSIAFVPARAGSKGVPGKNIKPLAGKPLVFYTIDAAIQSQVDTVVLSSDSSVIHSLVKKYVEEYYPLLVNKLVYHVRPESLASDTSCIMDGISHFLANNIDSSLFDILLLLQPTSPFRDVTNVNAFLDKMVKENLNTLISVCEVSQHPSEVIKVEKGKLKFLLSNPDGMQRQQYDPYYYINGAMYGSKLTFLQKNRKFIYEDSAMFLMEEINSIDIDTSFDFTLAEKFFALTKSN